MRRIVSALLALTLTVTLFGCGSRQENLVSFYYCRDPEDYQYFDSESVICMESRDIVGHSGDIPYIIGLYLAGPMEEGLISPLPRSVRLFDVEFNDTGVVLTFSDVKKLLTDSEFSLACACLTLTCADLTGCSEVTVISGSRTVTMHTDSICLTDNTVSSETTEGE